MKQRLTSNQTNPKILTRHYEEVSKHSCPTCTQAQEHWGKPVSTTESILSTGGRSPPLEEFKLYALKKLQLQQNPSPVQPLTRITHTAHYQHAW